MKPKKLTIKNEEKISLLGNCIFSEARLFPYKDPLLVRIPFPTLEKKGISFNQAENLITAINSHIGGETFIEILNGHITEDKSFYRTMITLPNLDMFNESIEGVDIKDEKNYLILWIFKFLDLEKKFKETYIDVSELASGFNERKSVITFGDTEIPLPPMKNESTFCRVMFDYGVKEPVDWSEVWNKMENTIYVPESEYKKSLEDTTYLVNKRVKKYLDSDKKLFSWKNKTIYRNF